MGAMGADHGPPQLSTVASVPELGAEVMPPLWQYFARVAEKADERIFAPRGMRPCTLSKISGRFAGIYCFREGHGNGGERGRSSSPHLHAEREGHAPVVPVLLAAEPDAQAGQKLELAYKRAHD